MQRFPIRTLVLMLMALLAFFYFWWSTHSGRWSQRAPIPIEILTTLDGGAP